MQTIFGICNSTLSGTTGEVTPAAECMYIHSGSDRKRKRERKREMQSEGGLYKQGNRRTAGWGPLQSVPISQADRSMMDRAC